jgi:hypothetical protein
MRKLVFVHGRSQQHKDASALKQEWLDALHAGFRAAGIDAEIDPADVAFPYYGDTLAQLAENTSAAASDVIIAGAGDAGEDERQFVGAVVAETVAKTGLSDADIAAEADAETIEKGPLNWPWVLAALRALDRRVPGASSASVALATHDVYMYLRNAGIQRVIDRGVVAAIKGGQETVVVAHSLGTVVAYNVLSRGPSAQWSVPSLLTLGSPLGVRAIVDRLAPITYPAGIGAWFNAFDVADTVALFPLDSAHFPVTPAVENYAGVHNPTPNRHGISGYLGDPVVARRIHSALVG